LIRGLWELTRKQVLVNGKRGGEHQDTAHKEMLSPEGGVQSTEMTTAQVIKNSL
jgi:hypothetical protein